MADDMFKTNFALLKKHYPHLWQALKSAPPEPAGELVSLPDGRPNLRLRGEDGGVRFLHYETDPEAEIPEFLRIVSPDATGVVVFLGMGLGYSPLAMLRERGRIGRMVIFERQPGLFWQALHALDLRELIKNSRVSIIVGPEPDIDGELGRYLPAFTLESVHILEHRGAFSLDPEGYAGLKDDFFRFANSMNIEGNTVTAFGGSFVDNRFRQLSAIHHDFFLDALSGAFAGVPAVLVAGGPSLDKNIHLLEKARGRAVIIAVDSVIPALTERGLLPDFVGSIDMQPLTYDKYGDAAASLPGVSLICAPWVNPRVSKYLQTDRVFWLFSRNNMEAWLNHHLGGQLMFPGAGTVAQLNFFAAIVMGCSPIVFIGQDLAFTGGRDHAAVTVLSDGDKVAGMLSSGDDVIYVKGAIGGEVPTKRAFIGLRHTFEEMIRSNPNDYINATEGGAHIEGTRVMPLAEALAGFAPGVDIDTAGIISRRLAAATPPDVEALQREFVLRVKKGKRLAVDLTLAAERGEKTLAAVNDLAVRDRLFTCFDNLPPGLKRRIVEEEKLNHRIDRDPVWPLLQDLTVEGLRQAERLKAEADRIEADPRAYISWLRLTLERVLAVNRVRAAVLDDFIAMMERSLEFFVVEKQFAGMEGDIVDGPVALLRLYMEEGNIRLAREIVEKLFDRGMKSPEIFSIRGRIAALQADFTAAEEYFAAAAELDSETAAADRGFMDDCAREYLGYAISYEQVDQRTYLNLLLKALRFSDRNEEVCRRIQSAVAEDCAAGGGETIQNEVLWWRDRLGDTNALAALLSPAERAAIHAFSGGVFFADHDYHAAEECYEQAAALSPDDPDLQVALFEAAFNSGEFSRAAAALNRAVVIDCGRAGLWEDLGDILQGSGNYDDAIAAYEQCYLLMPDRIYLLRRIGDCHLALGRREAALASYKAVRRQAESLPGA